MEARSVEAKPIIACDVLKVEGLGLTLTFWGYQERLKREEKSQRQRRTRRVAVYSASGMLWGKETKPGESMTERIHCDLAGPFLFVLL